MGELIHRECFEREKWERKNRIVRKISDRGRETERRRETKSGGVSNSKMKIKNYFFIFIFLHLLKNQKIHNQCYLTDLIAFFQ